MTEKIFIGVAWPYANGSLHLGHIAGCYLPADIFARYHRLKGNDVLMVSGSDEHGTPITITAENQHTTPQEIVDQYHSEHAANMNQLGISFDLFTRTTTKNHEKVVQDIFMKLYTKELIYPKTTEAYYCEKCGRFLPDRYIECICPYCHSPGAKGDQCDHCGKLLDTCELEEVRCKLCGGTPIRQTTKHLFFSLSSFESKLLSWIAENKHWKANVLKFTHNWLTNGLHDRAITRDIEWGVPVPLSDYNKKRIYVWFDAVIGYLSASKEWAQQRGTPSKWEEWWKAQQAQHYYFLAKDNIPFHSIIWPSILMGYDSSLKLPYDIPANEYLCLKGQQFSKSRCVAIWVPEILKQFDADAIRYYLSINMPENKDSNWLWNDFVAKNNDELVGTYGNFVHRVLTFTSKNFGVIPEHAALNDLDNEAVRKIKEASKEISASIEACSFKKGLRLAMNLAQFGNFYFDQNQPWTLVKNDKTRCGTVLYVCLRLVQALAVFMTPYLPFSSAKLWQMLGNVTSLNTWEEAHSELTTGIPIEKPKPLFKKLDLIDIISESDPFSKLDLRVAKVVRVEDHQQADRLYILHLDLGPLGKRSIVAGMKPYYTKEELCGKTIVLVVNLKPAKIRGIESKGMLLAAEDEQGVVSLLEPQEASPGSEVSVEDLPREPVPVLEFEDFKQVTMIINEKQQATYNGKPLKTKKNIVVADRKVQTGAKIL
jgi:methionyl-tRNA synthetase